MGQKMKNAPVYFTIVQVRHNPVLSLDTYIPGIQESMRRAGYPDFKKGVAFSLNPAAIGEGAQSQLLSVQRVERYSFSNMESTRGFVLQQNALSYEATEYGTFETFSGEFLKGLEVIHNAVGLDFSERVGLRYLDAVVPRSGEQLSQYLVPEVLGLSVRVKNGSSIAHSFAETLILVDNVGQVVSRVIIQNGPLGFPPDLQPGSLTVADRFAQIKQVHAVIDTDGAFEGRDTFDIRALNGRIRSLHDEIIDVFHETITDHARVVWE